MRQNIPKLYLLNFLTGIVFWYPIEKLFLQHIGVGAFGVSINAVVFLAILVIFDVPSGVLADKWQRKYTLILAILSLMLGSIIGGFSSDLAEYLTATILVGGFVVLTSGTFQAIMYDSLRDLGKQDKYDKHQGRSYALFLAGLGFSSIAGGYIAAQISFSAAYFGTALVMLIALAITTTLREPAAHKAITDRKLKEHVRFSVQQIFASKLLLQLCLLITAASILRSTQNEYSGLLFIALGLTSIPMGYATAAKWLVSSLGQVVAPKIGRRALRLVPFFFISFAAFSLIQSRWSLVLFYIASFLFSTITNQAEAAVQDNTPSDIRATTLSVVNFASNVILIPLSLLFGWIAQSSNIFSAYFMIGLIGLLYLASWLLAGRKILSHIPPLSQANQTPSIKTELI